SCNATLSLDSQTAAASFSSPGPWLTATAIPRFARARATAPKDSADQHFAPQPAPGFSIARGSPPNLAMNSSAQASCSGSSGKGDSTYSSGWPATADTMDRVCSTTCAPAGSMARVYQMLAGASRGCEDPTRTFAPLATAASEERMVP